MKNISRIRTLLISISAMMLTMFFLEICCYVFIKAFHLEKKKSLAVEPIACYPKWWQSSVVLGLKAKPNFAFVYDGHGRYLGTDSYGFCHNGDPDRKLIPKQKNIYRIFVLGGSTVWGRGVSSNEDTIPAQMEKMINVNSRYPFKVEVINAGMRGWMSYQEFCYLTKDLLYYEPDMVVVLDGINDFYYPQNIQKLPPNLSPPLAEMERMLNMLEESRFYMLCYHIKGALRCIFQPFVAKCKGVYGFVRDRSYLLDMMRKIVYRINLRNHPGKHVGISALKKTTITSNRFVSYSYYLQNLKNIIGVCRINSIDCVILFQPTLGSGQKRYMIPEEDSLLNEIDASFQMVDAVAILSEYYKKLSGEFKKLKSQYQGEHLFIEDLSDIFADVHPKVYDDAIHYNTEGSKILANRISNIIEENFLRRR